MLWRGKLVKVTYLIKLVLEVSREILQIGNMGDIVTESIRDHFSSEMLIIHFGQ